VIVGASLRHRRLSRPSRRKKGGFDVLDLNCSERRSLTVATLLVLLGTAVRVAVSPGRAEFTWTPADSSGELPTLGETRRAVTDALARRAVAESPLGAGERIDPNAATAEELERLPGIGPAKSFAIVEERRRSGPYTTSADLGRVPGIGPAVLERIAPYLTLRPSPVSRQSSGPSSARRVNLNAAGRDELMALPGIGPARADSILAFRDRNGGFRRLEELLNIPGIGAAILRALQGRVDVL
jgi:competence protein ComEA